MKNENFNNNLFKIMDICEPNDNKNIIISGTSIKFAFTMLLNGADGESKRELETFLGENVKELNSETEKILEECGDSLKLANSYWIAGPNQVNEGYREIIKQYQNAEIKVEDFQLPETLEKINNWIDTNTNGLIQKLLDELPPDLISMLINTLYFKAQWEKPFSEYLTHEDMFFGTEKSSSVQMMKTSTNAYLENEYVKGFGLHYENTPYEFIGILPNKEGDFKLEELDLNNLYHKNENYNVNVNFPKLDVAFEVQLKDVLKQIGLDAPFSNGKDFISMLSIPQVVSKIIHKTNFKLDEKGTEAAAATVIMMVRGMAIEKEKPIEVNLIFNRPFAFMIRHTQTHELLFIGKINNL